MDSKEFISALKVAVRDATIKSIVKVAQNPPGKKVSLEKKTRAIWLNSLNNEQIDMINSLVTEATDSAIFGFLCVLDGVRVIEDTEDKGRLELRYIGSNEVVLNSSNNEMLHDMYKDD